MKITIAYMRELERQLNANEITYSRMVEILNETVQPPTAQQAPSKNLYQLCPKCHGQGVTSRPPGVPTDVDSWSSTSSTHLCDVCNGAKILTYPQDSEEVEFKEINGQWTAKILGKETLCEIIGVANWNKDDKFWETPVDHEDVLSKINQFFQQPQNSGQIKGSQWAHANLMEDKAEKQNQRMREWFEERTGLKDAILIEHMKAMDKMLIPAPPTSESLEQAAKKHAREKVKPMSGEGPDVITEKLLEAYTSFISGYDFATQQQKPLGFVLPDDNETQKWFEENIGLKNDCSASSAIYKFRLFLRDRLSVAHGVDLELTDEQIRDFAKKMTAYERQEAIFGKDSADGTWQMAVKVLFDYRDKRKDYLSEQSQQQKGE